MIKKIINWYNTLDLRSPMEIEIEELRKRGKKEVEEVEQYINKSKRFILIDKKHQICGIYHFDILDKNNGRLYKNIAYDGVFKIMDNL